LVVTKVFLNAQFYLLLLYSYKIHLSEKIHIAGISRVTGIAKTWLQKYVNEKYENIPWHDLGDLVSGVIAARDASMVWSDISARPSFCAKRPKCTNPALPVRFFGSGRV